MEKSLKNHGFVFLNFCGNPVFCQFNRESDNEVWYYSTPGQIAEVLEVLDKDGYERELYYMIRDTKEDILRQMTVTEELTNSHSNNKKSAIEVEKGTVYQIQYSLIC